jgi:hypothetical protein
VSFCNDPNGYHSHECPGYTLERIADALEKLAEPRDVAAEIAEAYQQGWVEGSEFTYNSFMEQG